MDKMFEKLFGKSPGLDVVVLVMTGFMLPLVLRKETIDAWGLLIVPTVWVSALLLARRSGKWDDRLFDPLYGSEPARSREQSSFARFVWRVVFVVTFRVDRSKLARTMDTWRDDALKALTFPGIRRRKAGIYQSARTIFYGTEQWDKEIKPYLEFSKATRVFIWPLIVALFWVVIHDLTGWPPYIRVNEQRQPFAGLIGLSQYWFVIYLCLQGVAFLYLYLRLVHMRNLYRLVKNAKIFAFELPEKENPEHVRPMFSVGTVVMPVDALLCFKRRILCVGTVDQAHMDLLTGLGVFGSEVTTYTPAKTLTLRHLAKLVCAQEFDVYVISKSQLRGSVEDVKMQLKAMSHQITVYPNTSGTVMLLIDTQLETAHSHVAEELRKFLVSRE
jgi:hypothetical protein